MAICVIYGDFRFDNFVLDTDDPLKIIGVLDWELTTQGDPLMDLGNSLRRDHRNWGVTNQNAQ